MNTISISQPTMLHAPEMIAIDLDEACTALLEKLEEVEHLHHGEDRVLDFIMQCLSYRDNGTLSLSYEMLSVINKSMDSPYISDLVKLSNIIVTFGERLYQTFMNMGMYQNGYLFYQFERWFNDQLILRRLSFDIGNYTPPCTTLSYSTRKKL